MPLGTCCSGDLSQARSCVEERDFLDTVCLYKDTFCEYGIQFGDLIERKLVRKERKVIECSAAIEVANIAKVECIDANKDEPLKWKTYHHGV